MLKICSTHKNIIGFEEYPGREGGVVLTCNVFYCERFITFEAIKNGALKKYQEIDLKIAKERLDRMSIVDSYEDAFKEYEDGKRRSQ